MEEGFFSRLMQSRARGYTPDEQPAAAAPAPARVNPYQDVIESRGAAARNAIEMMRGGNVAGGLGNLAGSIVGSMFTRPTPSMEPVGRFVGGVFGGGEMPERATATNNAGFTPPDQIANLPTSNDLQSLMIRSIGRGGPADFVSRADSRPQAAPPSRPVDDPYNPVSRSLYDQYERPKGVTITRGTPTGMTRTFYPSEPSTTEPLVRTYNPDGTVKAIFRRDDASGALQRVLTPAEQAATRAQGFEALVKQAEALQKGSQGRKYAAEAASETQGVNLGELGLAIARQRYESSAKTPKDYADYLTEIQALRSSAKPSDLQRLLPGAPRI